MSGLNVDTDRHYHNEFYKKSFTHGNLWCNATTVNIYCIENKKQIDICMAHDVTPSGVPMIDYNQ
jgi:hypothetical protein